ncbi:hypothetical protein [Microbacterium sp. SD291]|uniref:hypothetical protein n=1 Tax=Microbacterium sp. SD291 TaxID=2782007 RepID=UPI001A97549B|nr:hypothetical protein [Microbacterium sp. SD291]MBO0980957.1 hypothetical protein [Microbacterium sp. SD291]
MTHPRPLPTGLGKHFSTAQALAAGVTRRRLRAKDLPRPFHGARCGPASEGEDDEDERKSAKEDTSPLAIDRERRASTLELATAYSTVMPAGSFFVGRTAACLHGAPIDPGTELEVAAFLPGHGPRGRGIRPRKVAPHLATIVEVEGLPVSSPSSTWAMLGRDLLERELVIVGDALVRIPRDSYGRLRPAEQLTTIAQLRAEVDAGPRPPSTRLLRIAVVQVRVGSASPPETEFRLDAAAAGLPTPMLDYEVHNSAGRRIGISELAFPEFRTVVEIEGDHHRVSKTQWHRDISKYRDYEDAGWRAVRLPYAQVHDSLVGVSIVGSVLRQRGWR